MKRQSQWWTMEDFKGWWSEAEVVESLGGTELSGDSWS